MFCEIKDTMTKGKKKKTGGNICNIHGRWCAHPYNSLRKKPICKFKIASSVHLLGTPGEEKLMQIITKHGDGTKCPEDQGLKHRLGITVHKPASDALPRFNYSTCQH